MWVGVLNGLVSKWDIGLYSQTIIVICPTLYYLFYGVTHFDLHPLLHSTSLNTKNCIDPILLWRKVHLLLCFSMSTIRAHGFFVLFSWIYDGHVDVLEDLLNLKFNLYIKTMYLEHKMYFADGEVYKAILVHKNIMRPLPCEF